MSKDSKKSPKPLNAAPPAPPPLNQAPPAPPPLNQAPPAPPQKTIKQRNSDPLLRTTDSPPLPPRRVKSQIIRTPEIQKIDVQELINRCIDPNSKNLHQDLVNLNKELVGKTKSAFDAIIKQSTQEIADIKGFRRDILKKYIEEKIWLNTKDDTIVSISNTDISTYRSNLRGSEDLYNQSLKKSVSIGQLRKSASKNINRTISNIATAATKTGQLLEAKATSMSNVWQKAIQLAKTTSMFNIRSNGEQTLPTPVSKKLGTRSRVNTTNRGLD